ncbi:MAG: uroporphyrinogen-III C-methyltransferase [Actinomycetota bacterium]
MTVYLVGAGPGDPGLITVKGAQLLSRADVVIHDRLVGPEVLALAPDSCELISAAKEPRRPTLTQDEINALLIDRGRRGQHVVRLKGGDPCVFARGGEEAAALAGAGVDFEIVPGITSAIAAPAYAGIPVTLRHEALSVTFVTGHEDPQSGKTVDWEAIAATNGTIVILMGAGRARQIGERLETAGLDPSTPAAWVHWGTHAHQQVWRGALSDLGRDTVPSPSVMVVGAVAGVDVSWFAGLATS